MIIAIHGKAQSGKDTLGRLLKDRLDGAVLLAFADPVKQLLMTMYGLTWEQLHTEEGKASTPPGLGGQSVRQMLIDLGQGLRALLGYSVWVDHLIHRLGPISIVTDMRDALEYGAMVDKKAITVKLLRDVSSSATNKRMEYPIPDRCFDYVIDNRGMDEPEFKEACNSLINEILKHETR